MDLSQLDYATIITTTLNTLFSNLFSSIDNTLYSLLDQVVFIDTSIVTNSFFDQAFGSTYNIGLLAVADSIFFGFVLYYCIRLILSSYTASPVESPYIFAIKAIIIGICINSSQFLCEQLIYINSLICDSIKEIGLSIFGTQISFTSLISQLNSFIATSSFNIFSFDGIVKSFVSFGFINILFSYSLRYILIKVFVLLSPFAILSLSNITTSWFFKVWIKNFFSLLLIQSFISLIFLILFSFDGTFSSTFSQLMYVGAIYSLMKANQIIREIIGGISTDMSLNINSLKSFFK